MKIPYKKIAICLLVAVAAYVVAINLYDLYTIFYPPALKAVAISASIGDQPLTGMSASAFGISAVIENTDTWSTVAKVVVTILGTYLGVKLINKYIKT